MFLLLASKSLIKLGHAECSSIFVFPTIPFLFQRFFHLLVEIYCHFDLQAIWNMDCSKIIRG